MGVVIRLQRAGARNRPFYRMVVVDSRKPRDGAFLEKVGYYDPIPDPEVIQVEQARIDHWIGQGAKLSDGMRGLMKRLKHRSREAAAPTAPEPEASDAGAEKG